VIACHGQHSLREINNLPLVEIHHTQIASKGQYTVRECHHKFSEGPLIQAELAAGEKFPSISSKGRGLQPPSSAQIFPVGILGLCSIQWENNSIKR